MSYVRFRQKLSGACPGVHRRCTPKFNLFDCVRECWERLDFRALRACCLYVLHIKFQLSYNILCGILGCNHEMLRETKCKTTYFFCQGCSKSEKRCCISGSGTIRGACECSIVPLLLNVAAVSQLAVIFVDSSLRCNGPTSWLVCIFWRLCCFVLLRHRKLPAESVACQLSGSMVATAGYCKFLAYRKYVTVPKDGNF